MAVRRAFRNMPQNAAELDRLFRNVDLPANEVDNSQLRDSIGCSVIGRSANSTGSPADIQATATGQYLRRSGDVLGFGEILESDIPSTIARDSEVTTAIANHVLAADPHPGYLTQAEGDARYIQQTTGTYEATLTGCTTSPTVTVRYVITGSTVTIYVPSVSATSNATSCTLTGAPVAIRPTRDQGFSPTLVQDNSALLIGLARMQTTGTIDLRPGAPFSASGWTAANTKGADHFNLSYTLT